jgi:hypothetical protein
MAEQQATMVAVRLRPPSAKETAVRCIKTDGDKSVQFSNPDKSFSQYSYDKVFGESQCVLPGINFRSLQLFLLLMTYNYLNQVIGDPLSNCGATKGTGRQMSATSICRPTTGQSHMHKPQHDPQTALQPFEHGSNVQTKHLLA